MENNNKYGQLLTPDAKLHRQYFREMVKLYGVYVLYRSPCDNKKWTTYAELDSNFNPPILVGCLLHDHPDQKTLKKMGWVAELQESALLIDVDYDLPNLQAGSLFILPSGIDNAEGRLFRVNSMQVSMIYPSCVTCEIVPEYIDKLRDENITDFTNQNHPVIHTPEQWDLNNINNLGNSFIQEDD